MVAAPTSGSGKTTVARALMAHCAQRGLRVQPFKCGPDYIDTKFHEAVCGRPSVNLDSFMAPTSHIGWLFHHYGADADVCIVEGMMGLFDGYDRDSGSSAEIARVLGLPVVLVVDARSAAYSTAALLTGFINFDKDVHVAGVIFNKVGSERHAAMLRQVCDDLHTACLGCLRKDTALAQQGERYLGLDFSSMASPLSLEEESSPGFGIDWERLMQCQPSQPPVLPHPTGVLQPMPRPASGGHRRTVIARNGESFSFLYQETIDALGEVLFFDPETEVPPLHDTDLLYLPGGYPEKHLEALSNAQATRQAIRTFAERGGRVIAECGGMMYLCNDIVTDEAAYPMCGVLPYTITARTADRKLSLGYRQFTLDGREYRGHEFHYTQFLGPVPPSATQVFDARGKAVATPVFRHKNVLASYTHLYNIVSAFVTK